MDRGYGDLVPGPSSNQDTSPPGQIPRRRPAPIALVLASHPAPALAVTLMVLGLGVGAGLRGVVLALLGAAVLTGQLSIGWLNDWLDRDRDQASGRLDKPLATGDLAPRTVAVSAATAGAACIPLSYSLGVRAGTAHVAAVGLGYAYDLGLKRTVWSWLPYAVAFGLLPFVVWLALPGSPWPPVDIVAAAALLGVGAHGANALPDRDDDLATGVRGLPQRLPRRVVQAGTAACLGAAVTVLVLGAPGPPGPGGLAALLAGTGLALLAGAGRGRWPMPAAIAVGLLAVGVLLARSFAS
jgi:4-hydroxybenzoate polyprenyltransferase